MKRWFFYFFVDSLSRTASQGHGEKERKGKRYAHKTNEKSIPFLSIFSFFFSSFGSASIQHRIVTLWTWSVYKSPIYLLWTAELWKKRKKAEKIRAKKELRPYFFSIRLRCEPVWQATRRVCDAEEVSFLLLLTFARTEVSECLCVQFDIKIF